MYVLRMEALAALEDLVKAFPPPKKPKSKDDEQDGAGADDDSDGGGDPASAGAFPPGSKPDNDNGGDADPDADGDANGDDDGDGDGPPNAPPGQPGQDDEMPPGAPGGTPATAGGGDVNGIATQLVQAERDFYAARGFHGDNHHNTSRALDIFHRLVRKLVRAVTGGKVVDDAAPGDDMEGGDAPPGAPGQQPPGAPSGEGPGEDFDGDGMDNADDPDADGDGIDDGSDDDFEPADSDGDGVPDDEDEDTPPKSRFGIAKASRAMLHGYRAFAKAHGLEAFLGLRKAMPEHDGSWIYPWSDELVKGTYEFQDRDNMGTVPEQFLQAYLVAFIEAAYDEMCRGTPCANDVDVCASKIMVRLVTLIPRASNLKRAAEAYKVTESAIGRMLKQRGVISIAAAASVGDAASLDAMGASGLASSMQLSGKSDWFGTLSDVRSGVPLKRSEGPKLLQLVDDRRPITSVRALRPDYSSRDTIVKANRSDSCTIHSNVDPHTLDMIVHPFAKCTCPR